MKAQNGSQGFLYSGICRVKAQDGSQHWHLVRFIFAKVLVQRHLPCFLVDHFGWIFPVERHSEPVKAQNGHLTVRSTGILYVSFAPSQLRGTCTAAFAVFTGGPFWLDATS